MTTPTTEQLHSPPSLASKRPKGKPSTDPLYPPRILMHSAGILKNNQSYHNAPTDGAPISPPLDDHEEDNTISPRRPSMPNRELSEKEIVQMNTEINAGGPNGRRSSSARGSSSRRQSAAEPSQDKAGSPRLQWDEANLFLNEGQMGGKMKIDEPKTPFVHGVEGDPMAEDEDEMTGSGIDPNSLVVDELDGLKALDGEGTPQQKRSFGNDIPDLDLGAPERDVHTRRRSSDTEKKVHVAPEDPNAMDLDETARHGEGDEENMPADEVAKHRKFEEMRKRHYEMSNVKGMLG